MPHTRTTVGFAAALWLAAMSSAIADVPGSAAEIEPLPAGSQAPAFTVRRADGTDFRFDPEDLVRPAVLIFYRGGWCPYCNAHLGELGRAEPQLLAMGYDILFFSADRPELLYSSLDDPDLAYTLLSDSRMDAARALGIAFRVDDATVARYRSHDIDLEAASGETHHVLPVPAVFIVDRDGMIRYTHANPDYKVRLQSVALIEAARAFAPAPADAGP